MKLQNFIILFLLLQATVVFSFYLPGVAPKDFEQNSRVELLVNKLESDETHLPFNFYYLKFCKPDSVQMKHENIGQILMGSRIENSPYEIFMNKNESCKTLCSQILKPKDIKNFKWFIDHDYRVNWVIDNMQSAWRQTWYHENTGFKAVHYDSGFPIGWKDNGAFFVYNHFKIIIKIHKINIEKLEPDEPEKWRIVGFLVEPYSLLHTIEGESLKPDCKNQEFQTEQLNLDLQLQEVPSPSQVGKYEHGSNTRHAPEKLGQSIVFSYGIRFIESDIEWASRWDLYLYMESDDDQIHWFSIINSSLVVLFLSGIVAHILQRTISKDIENYEQLQQQDPEGREDETGWKQVHGDVFRPPQFSSILASFVGTGVQVIIMTVLLVIFALLGFLSPSNRGGLLQTTLLLLVFMSIFAGFYSSRINKTFKNDNWKSNSLMTAFMFPGVCFSVFFVLNFVIVLERSSAAIPFTTLLNLLFLWFGISLPLSLMGSALGQRSPEYTLPCQVNKVPRPIKAQKWIFSTTSVMIIGGILPFGSIFIEVLFIMKSMWMASTFYYMFGFLFLVFLILIITSAEVSIVITYFTLCQENYHWWWRSYFISGASGCYLFVHSILYLITQLEMTRLSSIMIYIGYMGLLSYAMFIFTGTIGFYATFMFLKHIFSLIKVD